MLLSDSSLTPVELFGTFEPSKSSKSAFVENNMQFPVQGFFAPILIILTIPLEFSSLDSIVLSYSCVNLATLSSRCKHLQTSAELYMAQTESSSLSLLEISATAAPEHLAL
jgi:hypothetical protein